MLPRLLLITAALLCAGTLALAQENLPNLIANPSLEGDLTPTGLPQGWTRWMEPRGAYTASVVDGGHTGEKALLVDGAGQYGVVTTGRVPIEPGKHYLVRGWAKLEGQAGSSAVVKLDFMKANGNFVGEARMTDLTPEQDGWRCLSVAAHSGDWEGAAFVAVAVSLNGKGKAWFDDLEMVVTGGASADGNLLANGSMEDLAGDRPAYWFPFTEPNAHAEIAACDDNPKEGKHCFCLKGKAPYAVAIGERYRIEAGRTYSLSGFVRVKSGQASIKIDYYQGTQYLGSTEPPPVSGNAWEQRSVTSQLEKYPKATHLAATLIAFGGNLDAYYDGVVLTVK